MWPLNDSPWEIGTCVLYPFSLFLSPSFGCLNFLLLLQHAHFGFKHNFTTSLSVLYHIIFVPTIYLFLFFLVYHLSLILLLYLCILLTTIHLSLLRCCKRLFFIFQWKNSDNKDHLQVLFFRVVYIFHSRDINNS